MPCVNPGVPEGILSPCYLRENSRIKGLNRIAEAQARRQKRRHHISGASARCLANAVGAVLGAMAQLPGREGLEPILPAADRLLPLKGVFFAMTKQEKLRLSAVLRAAEYLFLENLALKLVLEHHEVPHWQKVLERLLSDKEMLAGVRLKFRDLYHEIQGSADPSAAVEALLGELPAPKKVH
jgi:hypothetical protein